MDLSDDELDEREWSRVTDTTPADELHVYGEHALDPDWARLVASARYAVIEHVWVEHWFADEGDDFAPWLSLFAAHPPPALTSLQVGGYADRSRRAHLGPVAPTLAACPLTSLGLCGRLDSVQPLRSASLRELSFKTDDAVDAVASLLARSELPDLRFLTVSAPGRAALLAPHLTRLVEVELVGLSLDAAFFEALPGPARPGRLELETCWWPEDLEDEEAARAACERLDGVEVFAPEEGRCL